MLERNFVIAQCFSFGLLCLGACAPQLQASTGGTPLVYVMQPPLEYVVNAEAVHQTVDGFGVNVTPAQWRDGQLRPTLDALVDELGSTLIRLDCVGLANWMDPAKRNAEGAYEDSYLKEIYTSKVFRDCWETYRYLQSKTGVEVYLSISGRVPAGVPFVVQTAAGFPSPT